MGAATMGYGGRAVPAGFIMRHLTHAERNSVFCRMEWTDDRTVRVTTKGRQIDFRRLTLEEFREHLDTPDVTLAFESEGQLYWADAEGVAYSCPVDRSLLARRAVEILLKDAA